jgi:hypothetical protein
MGTNLTALGEQMRSSLTFSPVPAELAATLRETNPDRRAWVKPLEDGEMLRMSKRPQWVKADKARTGMKLKTRAAGDQTDDVFVWLTPDPNFPQNGTVEHALSQTLAQ